GGVLDDLQGRGGDGRGPEPPGQAHDPRVGWTPGDLPEEDPGLAVRLLQPAVRHQEDARSLPNRRRQAGRADHRPVPAGGDQPGLSGPARGQEHPRRDRPRALRAPSGHTLRRLTAVASGRAEADLVLTGGSLVNVFTEELQEGWGVAVADG